MCSNYNLYEAPPPPTHPNSPEYATAVGIR